MAKKRPRTEEFTISGDQVIKKVKEIIHGGNIRRITLKSASGETFIEVPLTVGVVGAILLPVWAAIGAIAALATKLKIVVEKIEPDQDSGEKPEGGCSTP